MKHKTLISTLLNNKIIDFNKSKPQRLTSINESCIHIDFQRALAFPAIQNKLCQLYCDWITAPFGQKFDYICPASENAIPMAAQISASLSIPLIIIKKDKSGNCIIDGNYKETTNILIIENIIITGRTCIEVINKLRTLNLYPRQILCLMKRSRISLGQMFAGTLTNGIVPLISLLNTREVEFIIKLQASKLCVDADVSTMAELINIIQKTSPWVSIIKTHTDMIKDFVPTGENNSPNILQNLKNKYGILLWEDRKFADTASITNKQITQGIHKISTWADIVSVHTSSGPEVFTSTQSRDWVDGCMIFAICHSHVNPPLNHFTQSLQMIDPLGQHTQILNVDPDHRSHNKFKNVIGVVTDNDIQTSLLKITSYNNSTDLKWADIIIIGKDIIVDLDLKILREIFHHHSH